MHCTQCGAQGSGKFCGHCGASLVDLPCSACGTELVPGTRFCPDCGSPHRAEEARAREVAALAAAKASGAGAGNAASMATLPWGVAGVLLVALLVVGGFSILGPGQTTGGAAPAGALGPAPNVDLASMTPGEAALRLFNRVAMAIEVRDSVEVTNFLPMAIDAHEIARPLDDGQLFRLSFLYRISLDFETALSVAREGLERSPDNVLLLSAAAEALRDLGETEEARSYYARVLEVWDEETARGLEEYQGHQALLPVLREEAEAFLAR